jgi:hypothetical protein
MGENIGRAFKMAEEAVGAIGDEGGIGDDGRSLPIYKIGDSVGRCSMGETGVNRTYLIGEGDEGRSIYHTMSEVSSE